MLTNQDRAAFERQWTAQVTPAPIPQKTGADLKKIFNEPDDPNIDVRKSSIKSLLSWAHHRQLSAIRELRGPEQVEKLTFWNGYKKAIQEILDMEVQ